MTTEGCILGAWAHAPNPKRILDIGTGTGLLSLMLAQRYPDARIDAVEVLPEAFEEAKSNFQASPWATRLSAFHVAVQYYQPIEPYDLIVCNPPFFVDSLRSANTAKNTAKHADTLSQPDLAQALARLLQPEGQAFVLYPEAEMAQFANEVATVGLSKRSVLTVRHLPGGKVFRQLTAFGKTPSPITEGELVIKEAHVYSEAFRQLLGSYYLEL